MSSGEALRSIVIVDDEPGFTRLLKLNLERTGKYVVDVINDPLVALNHLTKVSPDLILLDVIMPGIDGSDLSVTIRQTPELAGIPVVFLTASVGIKNGQSDVVSKYDDHLLLAKPVDLSLLIEVIENALET
ncbi:MAG: response regulator [Verrucomicrobiota bacterium]